MSARKHYKMNKSSLQLYMSWTKTVLRDGQCFSLFKTLDEITNCV